MIRSATAAPRSPAALGAELLETDRGYFESTAVLEPAGGATIARVPGLERVSAGCVVHRVDPSVLPRDPARWVELVEQRLLGHGCRRARFYLTGRLPALEAALLARGYRPQDEIGYALVVDGRPAAIRPDGPPAELRLVTSADDWAKLAFHRVSGTSCDGHDSDPEAWVELERIRGGGMDAPVLHRLPRRHLRCDRARVGRVVAPSQEPRGAPELAADGYWHGGLAAREGYRLAGRMGSVGAFVSAGDPSEQPYRTAGYEAVARQTEWMRPLGLRLEHLETP